MDRPCRNRSLRRNRLPIGLRSNRATMLRSSIATILAFGLAGSLAAQDRMPPIPVDKQTTAQKKAVADYKDLRKADLAGPPWTVLLRVPDLIVPSLELRLHNQTANNPLGQKLTEFAILIAAREWTNNFEW